MPGMTPRECILAALSRKQPDRLPMWETTIWPETLERWHAEGLPADVDLNAYFGLDPLVCVNDLFEPSFGLPVQVREESADFRVLVDNYGKTVKEWKEGTHTPAILAPAIRSAADWERLKPLLAPGAAKFNNPAAEAQYHAARARGDFIAITPAEPVWFVIYLTMGYEAGLMAMARQRDLVADMIATYTDYLITMLDQAHARGMHFDALWFWSDLCYKDGLLFSPAQARKLALPHWQRLGAYARDHGMKFIFHCDGYVGQLIPILLEAGLDAWHPLEARAGNDVREYKRLYGDRLCLIGNINADIVATNDFDQIEAEVAAKIPVATAGGGYIYNIDHSVPPTVSLAAYKHLLACVRKYGGR
jgi:uroporphyrinogen decarboxylase